MTSRYGYTIARAISSRALAGALASGARRDLALLAHHLAAGELDAAARVVVEGDDRLVERVLVAVLVAAHSDEAARLVRARLAGRYRDLRSIALAADSPAR